MRIALTNLRGSLGNLYRVQGHMAEMEACLQRARDLWETLARQDARNPVYRDWLATICSWQSRAAESQGDWERWARLIQQALARWQELADEQPGNVAILQQLLEMRSALLNQTDPGGLGGEAILRPLEEERALLGQRVGEDPADTARRKRLALTCLVLGECHFGRHATPEALPCWRQAYEHYRKLAALQPDDPLAKLNLALCCSRLMGGQPSGPYYTEAVGLLGQAGSRLAALAQQHPGSDGLHQALLDTYWSLAVCHWRAGRTAQAERVFQDQMRHLAALLSGDAAARQQGFNALHRLLYAAGWLEQAKPPAALKIARAAAALAERYADTPYRDLAFCEDLAVRSLDIAAILCRLGDPGESLRQAEQARRLYAGLRDAAPDMLGYTHGLSVAWERIAKARWELGRGDEALAAFREAAAVQRQVVERAPAVRTYRAQLSRCYDRLAYWGGLRGDWAGVAAALRERQKLWPDDPEALREVARAFHDLAEMMAALPVLSPSSVGLLGSPLGQAPLLAASALCPESIQLAQRPQLLSPGAQAQRQRYLAESERARRAAQRMGR